VSRWVRSLWAFLPSGRHLSDEVWARRHHGLVDVVWLQVPVLLVFASYRGYAVAHGLLVCSPMIVAGFIAVAPLSRWVRCASVAIALVGGASALVYLSGGAIEAHFQYFVVIAFLSLYQEWMPFLIATGFVLFEHIILGVLAPTAVYDHDVMPGMSQDPWKWAFIHAGFLFAAGFANVLAWRLTEQEALHDSLTGLPNRVLFLEAVERACERRRREPAAVLFIDLDNFKDVNDGFGHASGDHLLRAITVRLRSVAREGDLIARLGGDEFAIVLRGVEDSQQGHEAANRYLSIFSEPFAVDGLSLVSTASIGLVLADDQSSTAADLMRNADLAMYDSKRNGGARVTTYDPEMHDAVLRRTTFEAELRAGLAREEFVVYYQPIIEVSSGDIVGNEALVRWQHPERGLLSPMEFIPAAEQSGLVVALDRWVLRAACRQTASWHRQHPDRGPLTVSVNISPRQLSDRQLLDTVITALSDADLDPRYLCLEITEGAVIEDFDGVLPKLRALKNIGVSLALDDFGTGYSSLSYLRQLPVDSLKIDRSFIADLTTEYDHLIVLAIIDLAHALGLSVTAEGVETQEQLSLLRGASSNLAQGYLLGRPMPAQQMTELLAHRDASQVQVGA
jgi:diguanylate cyclase (GGDEF)-like protein